MKWIASLTLLLALAGGVLAAGTDDQYLDINSQIYQADSLQQGGHLDAAATKYRDAQSELQRFRADHPAWNNGLVDNRLQYLTDKLKELAQYLPAGTNAAPAAVTAKLTPQQMQDQINNLAAANEQLRQKIKEALTVQPAGIAPDELARERENNVNLQKQRDLLLVDLEQQKAAAPPLRAPDSSNAASNKLAGELAALKTQSSQNDKAAKAQIAELKRQVEDQDNKLAAATAELNKLKSRPPPENIQALTAERDKLKKDLTAMSMKLADREAHPETPPAAPSQDAVKLKQVEQERDNLAQERDKLARQVAALSQPAPNPGTGDGAALSAENTRLRARLAELEAAAVPYTTEELAVIAAAAPAPAPAPVPVAGATLTHKAHSLQDLPAGAGPLVAEAQRAAWAGDYAQAESKFRELLAQDPDNVYVLVNLGNTQCAEGHLDDCEKNVGRALALDSNDAGALYVLGSLRYHQKRLDEALDALSRSDSINSTNAITKNFLGCVLSDKGLRTNAETAFRKALQLDPDYADAHFNLAFVYATEKPPAPALANFHYQRAVALRHPRSDALEKLIAGGP